MFLDVFGDHQILQVVYVTFKTQKTTLGKKKKNISNFLVSVVEHAKHFQFAGFALETWQVYFV